MLDGKTNSVVLLRPDLGKCAYKFRFAVVLLPVIGLVTFHAAEGAPPVEPRPASQQGEAVDDTLRITVVGQRFATKLLPYKSHGGRDLCYLAREVEYRVLNTTDHDVFFVSTEPLPINLEGTRFSQSLSWPDDIRIHRKLVPVPTVTHIASGEEERLSFAYAQDAAIEVEFAYADNLDSESTRKLVEFSGRTPKTAELDWIRKVTQRQEVKVEAIPEMAPLPVRVTPSSYTVHRFHFKNDFDPHPYRKEHRTVFEVRNVSRKSVAFLWTGAMSPKGPYGSAHVTQSLRWGDKVIPRKNPPLTLRLLRPGDTMTFESTYSYDRSAILTNFAYFEDPTPDDWNRLSRLNGVRSYRREFQWLLDNTNIVQVEFAMPTVPEKEVKDSYE